jgi:hypothetical protein
MNEQPARRPSRLFSILKEDVPLVTKIAAAIALICAALHLLSCLHTGIADFFNDTLGRVFRAVLAFLSGILPFSIAETLLYSLLPLGVLFIILAVRAAGDGHRFRRLIAAVLLIPLVIYILFVFTIGFAYRTAPLDEKLGLSRDAVSAKELYETALIVRKEATARLGAVAKSESGSTVMPFDFREMNDRLMTAYGRLSDRHPFLQRLSSRVKPVLGSEAMAYTHIAGVYTYMTGEANVNLVFPDYSLVFTSAHELAHQRGIARENEANFIAFLVCIESEDVYVQYAGYMNMLEYLINALAVADRDLLNTLLDDCDDALLYEMIAYNKVFEKYSDSVVGDISSAINDAYLQSQGTPGYRSYGMVVDLAVAYYR